MKTLKWVNTGAFMAMIAVNALAELLPIGEKTTAEISAMQESLFTPAPVTFAIWGVIYLMLFFFVIWQHGLLDEDGQSTVVRERIGPWFAVSCALNIAWIFLWHYQQFGLSVVCIAALLLVLILIVKQLDHLKENSSRVQRVTANAAFSLYFGWIIAATIANISFYLKYIHWNMWSLSQEFWTVIVLLVGTGITGAVVIWGKNRIAALAVMWAYAGILIRHISTGEYPSIIIAGILCEGLLLAVLLLPVCLRLNKEKPDLCMIDRSQYDHSERED